MASPPLSAIVLNFGTPKETAQCIRALLRQTIISHMEILLIDNHSDDESIQWIRNMFRNEPQVRILETNRNLGYGQGNQAAIKQAGGDFLLIINPDNELEPDGAEKMIKAMEADPSIGLLAPSLVHSDGTVRDSVRAFPTPFDIFIKRTLLRYFFQERLEHYLQHGQDPSKVRGVDWIAGACFLIKRSFYEEIGGFDPRFFLFFEDTDLCRRIWAVKKRVVYDPRVTATDRKHRLSQGGILTFFTKWTVRTHLRSAVRYFWKWKTMKG
jgi:hypothetical protein